MGDIPLDTNTSVNYIFPSFISHIGLVKIRVGIYVAQLTKNELLNFSLLSQWLFLPNSLRLEFNNGFKICQTIF